MTDGRLVSLPPPFRPPRFHTSLRFVLKPWCTSYASGPQRGERNDWISSPPTALMQIQCHHVTGDRLVILSRTQDKKERKKKKRKKQKEDKRQKKRKTKGWVRGKKYTPGQVPSPRSPITTCF